jgi:hypothetical protein
MNLKGIMRIIKGSVGREGNFGDSSQYKFKGDRLCCLIFISNCRRSLLVIFRIWMEILSCLLDQQIGYFHLLKVFWN